MRLHSVVALVVSFALPAAADPFDQLSAHAQAFETAVNAKNVAACAAMSDGDAVFRGTIEVAFDGGRRSCPLPVGRVGAISAGTVPQVDGIGGRTTLASPDRLDEETP